MAVPERLVIYPTFGQLFYKVDVKNKEHFNLPHYIIPDSIRVSSDVDFTILNRLEMIIVTKGSKEWVGRLVEMNDTSITISPTPSEILKIYNPDTFSKIKDTFQIILKKSAKFSVLIDDVSCRNLYTLNVDESTLQQNLDIHLPNTFGCQSSVVFGDIKMERQVSDVPQMMARSEVKDTSFYEYAEYPLYSKEKAIDSSIINFRFWKNLNVRKVYANDVTNNNVYHQYMFESIDHLPAGTVRIYKDNLLMGETMMPEVRVGRPVNLKLGTTSRVVVENEVIRDTFEEKDGDEIKQSGEEIEINIKLSNLTKDKAFTIIFSFFVGNKRIGYLEEKHERSDGYLYFTYKIDKITFTKEINFAIYN